jgi:hypothetical protein
LGVEDVLVSHPMTFRAPPGSVVHRPYLPSIFAKDIWHEYFGKLNYDENGTPVMASLG